MLSWVEHEKSFITSGPGLTSFDDLGYIKDKFAQSEWLINLQWNGTNHKWGVSFRVRDYFLLNYCSNILKSNKVDPL